MFFNIAKIILDETDVLLKVSTKEQSDTNKVQERRRIIFVSKPEFSESFQP